MDDQGWVAITLIASFRRVSCYWIHDCVVIMFVMSEEIDASFLIVNCKPDVLFIRGYLFLL